MIRENYTPYYEERGNSVGFSLLFIRIIGGDRMPIIDLTHSEIETLRTYLWSNPCQSCCVLEYKKINCFDRNENGEYRCRLQRDTESIFNKLEG